MRSHNTAMRGRIALIRKGSKAIVGAADLVGTVPKLSPLVLKTKVHKHQVSETKIDGEFKHTTAWVLERARPLPQPVPYRHPAGTVIRVNLAPDVVTTIEQQLIRRESQNSS